MGVGRLGPGPLRFSLGCFAGCSAFFPAFFGFFSLHVHFGSWIHFDFFWKHFVDDVVIAFSRLVELREI